MQTIDSETLISQLQDSLTTNILLDSFIIKGTLDLSDETISKSIKLYNCVFLDKLICTNTEFIKTVEFQKCKFKKGINCGDELHTHTIFHKDFILSKSILMVIALLWELSIWGQQISMKLFFPLTMSKSTFQIPPSKSLSNAKNLFFLEK